MCGNGHGFQIEETFAFEIFGWERCSEVSSSGRDEAFLRRVVSFVWFFFSEDDFFLFVGGCQVFFVFRIIHGKELQNGIFLKGLFFLGQGGRLESGCEGGADDDLVAERRGDVTGGWVFGHRGEDLDGVVVEGAALEDEEQDEEQDVAALVFDDVDELVLAERVFVPERPADDFADFVVALALAEQAQLVSLQRRNVAQHDSHVFARDDAVVVEVVEIENELHQIRKTLSE